MKNQTATDRLACLVADLPRDLADAILDAHRAAVADAGREAARVQRDRERLWENYLELSQRYHNEQETVRQLRLELQCRQIAWRAVRHDLRAAMAEDAAGESRLVGVEGIGMLLGRKLQG